MEILQAYIAMGINLDGNVLSIPILAHDEGELYSIFTRAVNPNEEAPLSEQYVLDYKRAVRRKRK